MLGPLPWAIFLPCVELLFFHPKILFIYQFRCRQAHENFPFACMNPVLMKLSTRVVNWDSNIFDYPPIKLTVAATVSFHTQYIVWKLMVAMQYYFHSGEIWNCVQLNALNFIVIFWKYKIQPLFRGKFLRLGVPREIVSRATLGSRAIGSPPPGWSREGRQFL